MTDSRLGGLLEASPRKALVMGFLLLLVFPTDLATLATVGVHLQHNRNSLIDAAPQPPSDAERGVYRTSDGGRTWTRVLGDGSTGASDVWMDFGDPQILFLES